MALVQHHVMRYKISANETPKFRAYAGAILTVSCGSQSHSVSFIFFQTNSAWIFLLHRAL